MHKIISNGAVFNEYRYAKEADYERAVVDNMDAIFGNKGVYFDVKRKIGKSKEGAAIPDGYYLDLQIIDNPVLYFIEIELSTHDLYGHIGEQVLRFSISSEMSKHRIKTILKEDAEHSPEKMRRINDFLGESNKYFSFVELLDKVVFDNEVSVIVVIDEVTSHLVKVLSKIKIPADIIEVRSFDCEGEMVHTFARFQNKDICTRPTQTSAFIHTMPTNDAPLKEVLQHENLTSIILPKNERSERKSKRSSEKDLTQSTFRIRDDQLQALGILGIKTRDNVSKIVRKALGIYLGDYLKDNTHNHISINIDKKTESALQTYGFRLNQELIDAIRVVGAFNNYDKSTIVRAAIDEYLKNPSN